MARYIHENIFTFSMADANLSVAIGARDTRSRDEKFDKRGKPMPSSLFGYRLKKLAARSLSAIKYLVGSIVLEAYSCACLHYVHTGMIMFMVVEHSRRRDDDNDDVDRKWESHILDIGAACLHDIKMMSGGKYIDSSQKSLNPD